MPSKTMGRHPEKTRFDTLPPNAKATLRSEDGASVYGCSWKCGEGRASQFGATWVALFFQQAEMAGRLVAELAAKPPPTTCV